MITLHDILDISSLTRDEIAAIAEHEQLPQLNAAALGEYMIHEHHGAAHVAQMIAEDIREALHKDDLGHARQLWVVLQHFLQVHPEGVRGSAP